MELFFELFLKRWDPPSQNSKDAFIRYWITLPKEEYDISIEIQPCERRWIYANIEKIITISLTLPQ